MANRKPEEQRLGVDQKVRSDLPSGVKLVRTLEGHEDQVSSLAFDPHGGLLASGSWDSTVKLWDGPSGKLIRTLEGHKEEVWSVAFDSGGRTLASGGDDNTVKVWEARSGKLLSTLEGHKDAVTSLAFDPKGGTLASGSNDRTVKVWEKGSDKLVRTLEGHQAGIRCLAFDPQDGFLASGSDDKTINVWETGSGRLLRTLRGHQNQVNSVAFDPRRAILATGSTDQTVRLWETKTGNLLRTLEGHTLPVSQLAFSADGGLLATKSNDQTIRLWNCQTWETVAVIGKPANISWNPALAFHPTLPLLAAAGSEPDMPRNQGSRLIQLWELNFDILMSEPFIKSEVRAIHHTTAKIVLVGDHSVGKSALGYRLIHNRFQPQESTHGQHFWLFPELGKQRSDGTECEAILWDFAGQPDYRLVHALFVDNADLALVLFDASDLRDPLHGVNFWLKQLQTAENRCPIMLVASQTDRGAPSLTPEELDAFCRKHGILGPIATSAVTGYGVEDLVERMRSLIPWDEKAATVTTTTFKRIKDYVLGLKGAEPQGQIIVTPEELRWRLQATDGSWKFSDAEMLTAIGHLENYGYVRRLRTSKGEFRILLQPERLNNLASSFEARRNPKGLGALEEKRLLAGNYDFPELADLENPEREVLLDSAVLLFLQHHVCFREIDPLRMEPYLVFPELINLKKPREDEAATEDGVAYVVSGPVENVFASLVVLLGYTHTFIRTAQWHNNARYEVGDGLVCGFRQEIERDGELNLVLCFGHQVGQPVRTLFQGLFETFLVRRNLTVGRYEPVLCSNGHVQNRAVVQEAMQQGDAITFCSKCGERVSLTPMAEPILTTREVQAEVESHRRTAEQRTRFEQAVFRVRAYVTEQNIKPPECFISYAWGLPEHERWVERRLATDLQKAGIVVLLDRRENAQIGASVARFVERIENADRVIVVGTPAYRTKFENRDSAAGFATSAEVNLIQNALLGREEDKRLILPVLLAGNPKESFPPLFRALVYADFRAEQDYFGTMFDVILSLYQLPLDAPAVADLRESLAENGR
jgi:small GTP-binding protein